MAEAEHPDDIFFAKLVKLAREQGDFGIARNNICFHGVRAWGELTGINATRIFIKDPTDAVEITAAEIEGRRQVYEVAAFLRKYVPGFANCEVSYIATQIAARESRRIIGEYVLSETDVLGGAAFYDAIAKFPCYIDLHDPQGKNSRVVFPKPDRPDENPIYMAWRSGNPNSVFETQTRPARLPSQRDDAPEIASAAVFDIPYRSLIPVALDGLLTAGRCISADHGAVASVRYLPASFATGQAAGTAAAMAALGNVRPRDLSAVTLRKRLVEQGAYLGEGV